MKGVIQIFLLLLPIYVSAVTYCAVLVVVILHSDWSDFVLVWEETQSSQKESGQNISTLRKWREEFLSKLRATGILVEQVSKTVAL